MTLPSASFRLMEAQTLTADTTQSPLEALDLGNYKELEIVLNVLNVGTAGTLKAQHAAINKEGAFMDLSGVSRSPDRQRKDLCPRRQLPPLCPLDGRRHRHRTADRPDRPRCQALSSVPPARPRSDPKAASGSLFS